MSSININVKSSNFHGFLLASYARFGKMSYLYSQIKAFFAFAKYRNEQKSARFHIVTYIE